MGRGSPVGSPSKAENTLELQAPCTSVPLTTRINMSMCMRGEVFKGRTCQNGRIVCDLGPQSGRPPGGPEEDALGSEAATTEELGSGCPRQARARLYNVTL